MSAGRGIGTMAWALAALLGASTALADGVCAKDYRDTTAAERATMTTVLETVKQALPPAPEGWVILGDDVVSAPTSLCQDWEADPWTYEFTRYYQQVGDQEARNKLIADAGAAMAADMQAKQPRLDALMARTQELGQELGTAAEKGDFARAEVINVEIAKLSEEYQRISEEGGITELLNAATEEASRDLTMTITATINPAAEAAAVEAESLSLAGAHSAFRWSGEPRGSVREDSALVLLGQWQPRAEGGVQLVPRANAAPPAAHAISIRAAADQIRLGPTIESIDFNALATSLLK